MLILTHTTHCLIKFSFDKLPVLDSTDYGTDVFMLNKYLKILNDIEIYNRYIQRVTEISTLILTGNRTRRKEQLFYLPFCRKTMFNSKKKKLERFFTKITLRH
jgi:hypothetical protein